MLDTGYWILVEDPNFRRDDGYLKLENRYLMLPLQPSTRNPQQSPEVGGRRPEVRKRVSSIEGVRLKAQGARRKENNP